MQRSAGCQTAEKGPGASRWSPMSFSLFCCYPSLLPKTDVLSIFVEFRSEKESRGQGLTEPIGSSRPYIPASPFGRPTTRKFHYGVQPLRQWTVQPRLIFHASLERVQRCFANVPS